MQEGKIFKEINYLEYKEFLVHMGML